MLLDHKEIIEIIKNDSSLSYVAFAVTPWHLTGVVAALLKLSTTEKALNGIILFPKNDYKAEKPLLKPESLEALNKVGVGYKIMYHAGNVFSGSTVENLKTKINAIKYFAKHKKGSRRIYVLNPFHLNDIFISRLKAEVPDADIIGIVVDEGLGVYMRSSFNWAVEQYHNSKSIKAFIRLLFDMKKHELFIKKASKNGEYINNQLLVKTESGFAENKDISDYYKQAVAYNEVDALQYSHYENAVVISAQLYFEDNQIKSNADLELYRSIIEKCKRHGISVVFKPHPRDKGLKRYDVLDCLVDTDNSVPQEYILSALKVKPRAVLSFTSTSLVTSQLFYGVKTASLNKLLKKDKVEITLQNEFDNFEKAFGNIVSIPESTDKLMEFLS